MKTKSQSYMFPHYVKLTKSGEKTVVKPEFPSFHEQDLQMRVKKRLIRTPILKTSKTTRHLIMLKTMKRGI